MRITRANIEQAKERAEELREALEALEEVAGTWLDFQDERDAGNKPDPDEVRDARDELELALETIEGFNVNLL